MFIMHVDLQNWMGALSPALKASPITSLAIPGTFVYAYIYSKFFFYKHSENNFISGIS